MFLAISDLTLALVIAGATAIGAAIGGAITGVVTLRAEDKRQAFSRDLEERRAKEANAARLAELRVAVRLVQDELLLVSSWIKHTMEVGEAAPVDLPRESWRGHRAPLAQALSTDAWLAVSRAFGGLVIFGSAIERGAVDPGDLIGLLEDVDAAIDALLPYGVGASLSVETRPIPGGNQAAEPPPKEP
jgi:hypothetical protein